MMTPCEAIDAWISTHGLNDDADFETRRRFMAERVAPEDLIEALFPDQAELLWQAAVKTRCFIIPPPTCTVCPGHQSSGSCACARRAFMRSLTESQVRELFMAPAVAHERWVQEMASAFGPFNHCGRCREGPTHRCRCAKRNYMRARVAPEHVVRATYWDRVGDVPGLSSDQDILEHVRAMSPLQLPPPAAPRLTPRLPSNIADDLWHEHTEQFRCRWCGHRAGMLCPCARTEFLRTVTADMVREAVAERQRRHLAVIDAQVAELQRIADAVRRASS